MIKKEDVKIGTTYSAVIGGLPADLKITGPAKTGGWYATNLRTRRIVHVRSADSLRLDLDAAEAAAEVVLAARAALKRRGK